MNKLRILIVAHGHPDLSKGGGEIAAYNLYKEYKKRDDVEVIFLAALPGGSQEKGTPLSVRRAGEFLIATNMTEYFRFAAPIKQHVWDNFRSILDNFKPDVVHFHHYLHLGIEMIREVKKYNPSTKIILTVHEYLAICYQSGQMIKRGSHKYCYEFNPEDCNRCCPEFTPQDYFLRKLFIQSFFELVDLFIAPSHFLRNRMIQWGIDESKILFMENAITRYPVEDNENNLDSNEMHTKFAFFGQINPFKGIDILLKAVDTLSKNYKKKMHLNIYGTGYQHHGEEFKNHFFALLDQNKKNVTFHGEYEPFEMPHLVQRNDWVVVPSIWWENSPVVIQEAFLYERPVICSNIGGMAEKIKHKTDGLHFKARDPQSLARVFEDIIDKKISWEKLKAGITKPQSPEEIAENHYQIYIS